MGKIFLTADMHIGHKNILKLSNRPFETIEQHDKAIINNYNRVVGKDDLCYILGDISWGQSLNEYKRIFSQLNGQKFVIIGNHDSRKSLLRCEKEGLILGVTDSKIIRYNNRFLYLSHLPCREWVGYYKGYAHVYGHTHANLPDYKQSTDVGVDCWEYEPVSIDEVLEYIDNNCEGNTRIS